MLPMLLLAALLTQAQSVAPLEEPDHSRSVGVVPPFQGTPAPPVWLRANSHELAALDCRHYVYEAYGDGKGRWLVRYVNFPEAGEAFREIEQVFLFTSDPKKKPTELKVAEVQYEPKAATYGGKPFALVDRRDLLKPE